MIADSGVRSSWLIVARKSLLARFRRLGRVLRGARRVVEPRVVERQRGAAGELLRHRDVLGAEALLAPREAEQQRARACARRRRAAPRAATRGPARAQQAQVLVVLGDCRSRSSDTSGRSTGRPAARRGPAGAGSSGGHGRRAASARSASSTSGAAARVATARSGPGAPSSPRRVVQPELRVVGQRRDDQRATRSSVASSRPRPTAPRRRRRGSAAHRAAACAAARSSWSVRTSVSCSSVRITRSPDGAVQGGRGQGAVTKRGAGVGLRPDATRAAALRQPSPTRSARRLGGQGSRGEGQARAARQAAREASR
jgi:hypothetical protein